MMRMHGKDGFRFKWLVCFGKDIAYISTAALVGYLVAVSAVYRAWARNRH